MKSLERSLFTPRLAVMGSIALLAVAAVAGTATAQDVKMYTAPPSVEELKSVLGGGVPAGEKKVKFRKLEFGAEESTPVASASPGTTSAPAAAVAASAESTAGSGNSGKGQAIGFPINFGYNSADIDPASRPFVDTIGQLMAQQKDLRLIIEGHTDGAGSDTYNRDLSAKRAQSVKRYIVNTYGIDPARLAPVGKGKSEPLDSFDPLNAKNRRVQFRPAA
ncbi:MAG: OmpA family protein [Alphaproteobacteria bacterium]